MRFDKPQLVKEIAFHKKAREELITGINILSEAVSSTLGAGGRTVLIEDDFGNPYITKDGVTVAQGVFLDSAIQNLGCTLLKQAAKTTSTKAGDGTTTSTVLAHALIHNYQEMAGKFSFRDLKAGVEKGVVNTVDQLEKRSLKLDDKRLEHVSTISANNDSLLGGLIAKAYREAGPNGVVTHAPSKTAETFVEVLLGSHLKGTPESHHFYTTPEKELCELENPLVFLCTSNIPNIRRIQGLLEHAIAQNRSILLIAPLEQQPLAALAMNKIKGNIKVNVISPPSFGLKRQDILDDIALLTGGSVVNEDLGDALDVITHGVLGSCDRAISDSDGTTLTFNTVSPEVDKRIEYLKDLLAQEDHHVMTRHIENRLAILSGGVSIIHVGGETEVEQKERIDRTDDAIHAVRAARKEGILPGGGVALKYLAENAKIKITDPGEFRGWEILNKTLSSPYNRILTNAGLDPKDYSFDDWGQGVDVTDAKVKDMRKAGIIDPVMVTKQALLNATSVALTILSTDAVICNVREK